MNGVSIRKIQTDVTRVFSAGGIDLERPHRSGSIAAVVGNPFVGDFPSEQALAGWIEALAPLATEMAEELRDVLAIQGHQIETYGKGSIVGVSGELEIAAAWHLAGGAGLRSALGSPKAMVPSSKKVGVLGSQLDVPLVHIHGSYLRSHYDVQPVVVADGPRPDEVVYSLVMSTGQRPNHRLGGFSIEEVVGDDGLR